jgi:hypothetical protein
MSMLLFHFHLVVEFSFVGDCSNMWVMVQICGWWFGYVIDVWVIMVADELGQFSYMFKYLCYSYVADSFMFSWLLQGRMACLVKDRCSHICLGCLPHMFYLTLWHVLANSSMHNPWSQNIIYPYCISLASTFILRVLPLSWCRYCCYRGRGYFWLLRACWSWWRARVVHPTLKVAFLRRCLRACGTVLFWFISFTFRYIVLLWLGIEGFCLILARFCCNFLKSVACLILVI